MQTSSLNKNHLIYSTKYTLSDFEDFKKIYENLIFIKQILLSTDQSNNPKLDTYLQTLSEEVNKFNTILYLENEFLKEFLESISGWILKNFSSPKLNPLLNFLILFFNKMNFKVEISREEIIKLLEVEKYDEIKIIEKKEKTEVENSEILSKDSFISNPFLSAFYALIVTIANKPEIIVKSKSLVKNVLTIFTQICEVDNVAIYYKKKRLISVFTKIIKELSKTPESEDSLLSITKLLVWLFSKIGLRKQIYKDYLFKKSIPEKITDLYIKFFKKDIEIVKSFGYFIYFTCRISDHKVFYWTKGTIENFVLILRKLVENIQKGTYSNSNGEEERVIESITFAIYHLSFDSAEVQSELIENKFLDIYKNLLMKYSKNNFIIYNIVSCLRRFKDDEFMDKIAEDLLYTFFALFDYFYLNLKNKLELDDKKNKELNSIKNFNYNQISKRENPSNSNSFDLTILKELIGLFGNIVKNEIHQKPFIEKNMHLVLIDVILSFINYPKIIKNTIGTMINLTANSEVRNEFSKVAAFIKSIYFVLQKYNDTPLVIDYQLKLLINILKNDVTSKIFSTGELFSYLLFYLIKYEKNDELILNSVKILRSLLIKKKNLEEFFDNLINFYEQNIELIPNIPEHERNAISSNHLMGTLIKNNIGNNKENESIKILIFYRSFLDNLVDYLIKKNEDIEIAVEILLFISFITNQDEKMKMILEKNEEFFFILRKIVNTNTTDETISKLISQCIAQLPIEEFDSKYYSNMNKN